MSLDSSLYSIEKEAAERLPYRFDEFLFEGISENYESISRCILFNESESLIWCFNGIYFMNPPISPIKNVKSLYTRL